MRFFLSLAATFGLFVCASGAAQARPFPNRAAVEAALNAHEACPGGPSEPCYPPSRYRLTRADCRSLGQDPINPGRIICFYRGSIRRGGDAAIAIRHGCAYFRPARRRGWEVAAYPDADMCE